MKKTRKWKAGDKGLDFEKEPFIILKDSGGGGAWLTKWKSGLVAKFIHTVSTYTGKMSKIERLFYNI